MGPGGFRTGDEVEVSSDEEGFRGAYFEARVVRSMPKLRRYTVEYDALVAEDDGGGGGGGGGRSRPLRETVYARHVRPRPPPSAASRFALHQAVDVLHNDAWWVGVVATAMGRERRRVIVSFPASRETLECELDRVRVHQEWVEGKWVLPEWMGIPNTMYKKGTQVEVACLKEENITVAWFPAVVSKPIWQNNFLVEYQKLRNDAGRKVLSEIVNLQHIRPYPPPHSSCVTFCLHDEVEAFYDNGWWSGVIIKTNLSSLYTVKSVHWDKEMKFSQAKLRLRYNWVDGQWIQESKKMLKAKFLKGTKVEVSSDEEGFRGAWFAATIVKPIGTKFLVEYQNLRTDDETKPLREAIDFCHIRPNPPNTLTVGPIKLLEEVDAFYNDGWWVGVVSKVLSGSRYMVYFRPWKEELEFGAEHIRLHHEWVDGRWLRASCALEL